MVRSKVIHLLFASAILFPVSVFAASGEGTPPVIPWPAKCLTPSKGEVQKTLEQRFESDLSKANLLSPKVKVKLKALNGDYKWGPLDLNDAYKDTLLTVTPVECVAAPCTTPPTITVPASSEAIIRTCSSVVYQFKAKYKYKIASTPADGGNSDGDKKNKIEGEVSGQIGIPGILAPADKNKDQKD